jgi:riboflavin synthase
VFTGIVTDIGEIISVKPHANVRRLGIACRYDATTIAVGASICCAGVCLTVVTVDTSPDGRTVFQVDAAPETLAVTTASEWNAGTRLNLERPLRVGDELGGHLVAGHVDGVATIVGRDDLGEVIRFDFEAPHALSRFIAIKGSVALDGTSLTVNAVEGTRFSCLLIPHTLAATTFSARRPGDRVNLEVDTMARYAGRLLEFR